MIRVGMGWDAHPLVAGRPLTLAGVVVPSDLGPEGHSDADPLSHAIVDALLGAAGLGDIGQHFPPNDPRYKDAPSLTFLEHAAALLRERRWRVGNVDATIILQKPKLAPYLPEMRKGIGAALGVEDSRVSVKAKTSNGLGFEGAGDGVSAQAVALIESES